jgi:hypothetical protein
MCVRGIDVTPISEIFRMDYGIVPTMWYFLYFSICYKLTQSERCWWTSSQMRGHKVVYQVPAFVFVPSIMNRPSLSLNK